MPGFQNNLRGHWGQWTPGCVWELLFEPCPVPGCEAPLGSVLPGKRVERRREKGAQAPHGCFPRGREKWRAKTCPQAAPLRTWFLSPPTRSPHPPPGLALSGSCHQADRGSTRKEWALPHLPACLSGSASSPCCSHLSCPSRAILPDLRTPGLGSSRIEPPGSSLPVGVAHITHSALPRVPGRMVW